MGSSQEVRDGDLVFCLFDVPETPRTVGRSVHSGMITGAYTVFEPLDVSISEYFEQFYLAMDDRKLLSPLYSGLRNTIPAERFLGTKTPLPPPAERAAIVRFLDWATRRLGRAISSKRKVITLLNEQKQAVIHRTITRGLDSSVPLKSSGISWLGDVPQHWNIVPNKYLLDVVESGSWGSDPGSAGVDARCIRGTDFDNTSLYANVEHAPVRTFSADEYRKKVLRNGDLILSTTGGNLTQATGAVVQYVGTEPALPTNFAAKLAPKKSAHSRYLTYVYFAMNARKVTERLTNRVTIANLDLNAYLRVPVPVPPLSEQTDIASHLDMEVARFGQAIGHLKKEIELFTQYRARLAADVVTGKLDVREAAARLSDEVQSGTSADVADLGEELDVAHQEATA
jgi:type I restriction enzyme S subunit